MMYSAQPQGQIAPKPPTHRWATLAVLTAIVLFVAYFGTISFIMHRNIITNRFDLGNMTQTVWNTAHGRFFQFTDPYGTQTISRYAYHADIILVLFAPLYAILPTPYLLLGIQVCIVGLGAWLLYRLGRHELDAPWIAAACAFAFLLYPTLQRAVLFDFHPLTLGATFAIGMVTMYRLRSWTWFWVFAALLMISKEELPLIVATFGLFMMVQNRQHRKKGLLVTAVAAIYFLITFFAIMPAARSGQSNYYLSFYETPTTEESTQTSSVFLHPRLILSHLKDSQARQLYRGLLSPVAYLSLASPAWLLVAWPEVVINLLSNRMQTHMLGYHYQVVIGAFVFIALVFGVRAILKRFDPLWKRFCERRLRVSLGLLLGLIIIGMSIYQSTRLSPLPYSRTADMRPYWPSRMGAMIRLATRSIPPGASVSATNTLGAQVANREHLYAFPLGSREVDYVLILMAKENSSEWKENHVDAERLAQDPAYELLQNENNFFVYKKR